MAATHQVGPEAPGAPAALDAVNEEPLRDEAEQQQLDVGR